MRVIFPGKRRQEGSVLIFVLLFMSFFLFLGNTYARHCLIEARIAHNYIRNIKAHYAAEGGLEAALKLLQSGEAPLGEGFLLEGGGTFTVMDGGEGSRGREMAAMASIEGAQGNLRVEVAPEDLFDPEKVLVEELDFMGFAGIQGGLHINSALRVSGRENFVAGDFAFSGHDAVFASEASLSLEAYQVVAWGEEDLLPFRTDTGLPAPGFNRYFYRGKSFPVFYRFENYLGSSYSLEEGPKRIIISGELDTGGVSEEILYHGVIAVTGPGDIIISGKINAGPGHAESQLIVVAGRGQDVRIAPNMAGDLEIGGSLLIFTGGDILVEGPLVAEAPPDPDSHPDPDPDPESPQPELPPPVIHLRGALACRRLSLDRAVLQHDPVVSPDLEDFLQGLPLLKVRWLKTH